ncbi:hypothetical protein RJT34_32617 [Clitoria ternatea]|uniref:Fe2OG dioxygenase domain-containing protein n=1 Tax=Clitoria ternatea TaxID=43366 RepID=A0AAN9I9P2_CLITE
MNSNNLITNSYKNKPSSLGHSHIVPLDFTNMVTVPDSHEWVTESVPVIDLSDPNAKTLIGEACEKWGAFQVMNHGVSMELLNQAELEAFRFFSLPANQKLRVLRSPESIIGYGVPRISSYFPKLLWSENFTMMGSPIDHAAQLWPDQPHKQTTFCDVMEECQKEMKALTERVVELMLESLGLTMEDLKWHSRGQCLFTLNSYPMCPEPERAMGLCPHTDTSLLTVLYQSSCTGLQVFQDVIGWIPVPPIPGAIVINIGDLMHILSNGRFKNILHRAVVNKTRHRVSFAVIYGPPSDEMISPLTKFTNDEHPPLYRPVNWKDYIYSKALHGNKALLHLMN